MFSLDSFFAMMVMVLVIVILLYTHGMPTHYYSIAYQARSLASDGMAMIMSNYNGDVEAWKSSSCMALNGIFDKLPYRFTLLLDDGSNEVVVCGDKDYERDVGITAQSSISYLISAVDRVIPGDPYFYNSCHGSNTPCDAINATVKLGNVDVLVVKLVVFI